MSATESVSSVTAITFREFAPEWAALSDKVATLSRREDEIIALIQAADRKYNWGPHAHSISHGVDVVRPAKKQPISEAAAALLGEHVPEPLEDPKPQVEYRSGFSKETGPLSRELDAIREALAVLYPQLAAVHQDASRRYCEAMLPEYRPIMDALCRAAVAFGSAMQAHRSFTDNLRSQGCEWAYLRPGDVAAVERAFGDPSERYSLLRRFIASAIEGSHVPADIVPDAWHHRPPTATTAEPPDSGKRKGVLSRLASAARPPADDAAQIIP